MTQAEIEAGMEEAMEAGRNFVGEFTALMLLTVRDRLARLPYCEQRAVINLREIAQRDMSMGHVADATLCGSLAFAICLSPVEKALILDYIDNLDAVTITLTPTPEGKLAAEAHIPATASPEDFPKEVDVDKPAGSS